LRRNVGRGQRDLALYETGLVFRPRPGAGSPPPMGVDHRPSDTDFAAAEATLPDQPWHVAAVLAGEVEPPGRWGAGRAADWSDAVQAARTVVEAAGAEAEVRKGDLAPWHPGRCAEIVVAGRVVGHAGELHPDVFEGAPVGEGRRSLAYKLTFRAPDRTLTVDEAVAARDAAVAEATRRVGAALRT